MNKPNYIETKLQEFKEHFVNPDPTSSADQFKPELRGKLYSEFEAFLTQALEEQAAGFEALIGEDEDEGTIIAEKGMDSEDVRSRFIFIWSRNSFRRQLREQLKGMRGK